MITGRSIVAISLLLLIGVLHASAANWGTYENSTGEIFSIEYDAPAAEATDLGNRTETSTSNYDTAPIHSAITEKIPTEANRALFGQNAEFKAAEGGAQLSRKEFAPERIESI